MQHHYALPPVFLFPGIPYPTWLFKKTKTSKKKLKNCHLLKKINEDVPQN